jgi:DNA-binding XRE family transcriptional regulator
MEKSLGICPTCYLIVFNNQPHVLEIAESTIAYHHECEPGRMKFMRDNRDRWQEEGCTLKEMREKNDFTVSELSEYLGVSETKIRKFESGKPVTHARLLSVAYRMFFQMFETSVTS